MNRRQALTTMGGGLGLATLGAAAPAGKKPHFAPKADRLIFLFLNGGLSQVDTFDPKPALDKFHGTPMPGGNPRTERTTGSLLRSPFRFTPQGKSGIPVSEIFPRLGSLIDEFTVIRSMHTNVPIHESSLFMMNCGDLQQGRPSMGSWLTYGLGSINQNLPGFVVLCPGVPVVGPPLWNSAFLPAAYQGTHINNSEKDPRAMIPYLGKPDADRTRVQRSQLDLLASLNKSHAGARPGDAQLDAYVQSMEIAFRMQTEAPEVFDVSGEPQAVREAYGEGDFARGCLMARRLVESGVRVVQVYYGNGQPWDSHEDIQAHRTLAERSDQPIAALIMDLKQRGLLDSTIVIVGSEFGRTPSVENSAATKLQNGRDHNPYGFTTLVAGGGFRRGIIHGSTDDFGFRVAEKPVHVHDLHATLLHQFGFDHTKLTYNYSGRDFRLTDVEGHVVRDILI